MNFYLKKTMMGYKICDEKEAEYRAWNLEDAKLLLNAYSENPSLKDDIKSLTKEKEDLKQENSNLDVKYRELVKTYNSLVNKYNFLFDENEKIKKFNNNLLKISRGKANAERNLRSRNSHHGYVIKKSETRYKTKTKIYEDLSNPFGTKTFEKKISYEIFDYILETPYNSNILENEVKNHIINDFKAIFHFDFTDKISLDDTPKEDYLFRIISLSSDEKSNYYKIKIQTNNKLSL